MQATFKKLMTALAMTMLLSTLSFTSVQAADFDSSRLVASAKDLMGIKYSSGGTTPSGFDCSGFVRYVFRHSAVDLPRTSGDMYGEGRSVSKSDLETGDLVFFKTVSGRKVSHVGIYIGDHKFIHSSTSRGVSISSLNDPYYWGSRYVGAKRVVQPTAIASVNAKGVS